VAKEGLPSSISVWLTPVIVTAILIYWGHDCASNYRSLSGLYRYVAEYYFLLGSALLYPLRFLHWLTTLFNFTSRPNLNFVLMCASLLIVAFAVYWPLRILFMRSRKKFEALSSSAADSCRNDARLRSRLQPGCSRSLERTISCGDALGSFHRERRI
jgi:hypothetical protein